MQDVRLADMDPCCLETYGNPNSAAIGTAEITETAFGSFGPNAFGRPTPFKIFWGCMAYF